ALVVPSHVSYGPLADAVTARVLLAAPAMVDSPRAIQRPPLQVAAWTNPRSGGSPAPPCTPLVRSTVSAVVTPNAKSKTTHVVADEQATLDWLVPKVVAYSVCVAGPSTASLPAPAATQTVADGHVIEKIGVDNGKVVQDAPPSAVRVTRPSVVLTMQND